MSYSSRMVTVPSDFKVPYERYTPLDSFDIYVLDSTALLNFGLKGHIPGPPGG